MVKKLDASPGDTELLERQSALKMEHTGHRWGWGVAIAALGWVGMVGGLAVGGPAGAVIGRASVTAAGSGIAGWHIGETRE